MTTTNTIKIKGETLNSAQEMQKLFAANLAKRSFEVIVSELVRKIRTPNIGSRKSINKRAARIAQMVARIAKETYHTKISYRDRKIRRACVYLAKKGIIADDIDRDIMMTGYVLKHAKKIGV